MNEEHPGVELTEAQKIFYASTSKKNLSGVRGRATRSGRTGTVLTPVDFLQGKAKKEYMKNGEVIVYNMYDNQVIPYEEFKALPFEKQVALMTKWREEIGTNNILKEFKISRKKFYDEVLKNLGIETKPRGKRAKENSSESPATAEENAFIIIFNGRHRGKSLHGKIAGLAGTFDHDREYDVKIEIRELPL